MKSSNSFLLAFCLLFITHVGLCQVERPFVQVNGTGLIITEPDEVRATVNFNEMQFNYGIQRSNHNKAIFDSICYATLEQFDILKYLEFENPNCNPYPNQAYYQSYFMKFNDYDTFYKVQKLFRDHQMLNITAAINMTSATLSQEKRTKLEELAMKKAVKDAQEKASELIALNMPRSKLGEATQIMEFNQSQMANNSNAYSLSTLNIYGNTIPRKVTVSKDVNVRYLVEQ